LKTALLVIIDNYFIFEELIPAICWIAPDIPAMAH
jgi:hypothetical protein